MTSFIRWPSKVEAPKSIREGVPDLGGLSHAEGGGAGGGVPVVAGPVDGGEHVLDPGDQRVKLEKLRIQTRFFQQILDLCGKLG